MTKKKKLTQRDIIDGSNLVANNPRHDELTYDKNDDDSDVPVLYDNTKSDAINRIIERFRQYYRTTQSGRKVRWDEPDRDDDPEIIRHNQLAYQQRKRKQNQELGRQRLKDKSKVPTKSGKPLFNQYQYTNESITDFHRDFNRMYRQGNRLTFKQWIKMVKELLDELD